MLEENLGMEKKATLRQSSALTKSTSSSERKSESSGVSKFPRQSKKRENGNGRGGAQPDNGSRRPFSQKSRSAVDKRPRQRGGVAYRQREEVVDWEDPQAEAQDFHKSFSKRGNFNHLLNFQYAPRNNGPRYAKQPRARRTRLTYNKERYLQANCQFVVKDSGDYTLQAVDPDALVDWNLVEQVRMLSHEKPSCPICLQEPAAGKITKCGHVFCWACILHYLSLDDRSWRKCPICYEAVHKSDLRSVRVLERVEQKVGGVVTLQLMKRERGSTYAVPLQHWQDRQGLPQNIHDEVNTDFAKVLVASADQIHKSVIEVEREALQVQLALAEPSEVCFIESALAYLIEREAAVQGPRVLDQLQARGGSGADSGGGGGGAHSLPSRSTRSPSSHSLPKTVSFHRAKVLKQYKDAFDQCELAEDEGSVSDDLSDCDKLSEHDDQESVDSLPSSCSPFAEMEANLQSLAIAPDQDSPNTREEDKRADEAETGGAEFIPAELAEESTMTAEEAVQQLSLPPEPDTDPSDQPHKPRTPNLSKKDFYFYQASDGQQVYLHSLNARCIAHQYGSLENGPRTLTATVLQKEITFMTSDIRRRLRYLSHLPLTCEFQVVEVELKPPVLSEHTLRHFAGDLKERQRKRQRTKKEDKKQARQRHLEEQKSYGNYPNMKMALDSQHHFPAPVPDTDERRRQSSVSDAASPSSSPAASPTELNAYAAEFVPQKGETSARDNKQSAATFSFAAAVKQQPCPVTWVNRNASNAAPAAAASPPHRNPHHSDESDNEDRVPVPEFCNSFSDAISAVLDTAVKAEGSSQVQTKGKAGKKKKESKLLFSTSMMRR